MISDLDLALYALESYDRAYDPTVKPAAPTYGDATLFLEDQSATAQQYGFYAVAYRVGNDTIISFRGTNFTGLLQDVLDGWVTGVGDPTGAQAQLAVNFYNQVKAQLAAQGLGGNIYLTGHSLGGGLAGFVGSLHGVPSVNFNNMAYEAAATDAYNFALLGAAPFWPDITQDIYGASDPWAPDFSDARTVYTWNEILTANRALQSAPQTELQAHAGDLSSAALHSQALLVALGNYGDSLLNALNSLALRGGQFRFRPALSRREDAPGAPLNLADPRGLAGWPSGGITGGITVGLR